MPLAISALTTISQEQHYLYNTTASPASETGQMSTPSGEQGLPVTPALTGAIPEPDRGMPSLFGPPTQQSKPLGNHLTVIVRERPLGS